MRTPAVTTSDPPDAVVRPRRRAGAWRWVYRLLLVAVIAAVAFVTIVPWWLQRGDTRIVVITSGSMVPLYPVGANISLDDRIERTTLQPGQIITFKALGNGTVITHRIVARVQNKGMSEIHYQTKGDANPSADPNLAPASSVIGVAGDVVPAWQQWAISGQSPKGRLLVFGSLFLLVALGELAEIVGGRRRATADGTP